MTIISGLGPRARAFFSDIKGPWGSSGSDEPDGGDAPQGGGQFAHLFHQQQVVIERIDGRAIGRLALAMELLEGRTLREIIAKEAPLELARSVSIMLQASAAVAAVSAHEPSQEASRTIAPPGLPAGPRTRG